jgi:hypothetical protein
MKRPKKKVADESPPEGPYIIRTGFHFDDERTDQRFELLMCSVEQNGSCWLEPENAIGSRRRLTCRTHEKTHAVISLREAAEWGVLDVADGCILVANDELLRTLARRVA